RPVRTHDRLRTRQTLIGSAPPSCAERLGIVASISRVARRLTDGRSISLDSRQSPYGRPTTMPPTSPRTTSGNRSGRNKIRTGKSPGIIAPACVRATAAPAKSPRTSAAVVSSSDLGAEPLDRVPDEGARDKPPSDRRAVGHLRQRGDV